MSRIKVVCDFGSAYFSLYSENELLLRMPSAVIIKRSLNPVALYCGEEALKRQSQVTEEELFVKPIQNGSVAHFEGIRLLIKEAMKKVFGIRTDMEICVLISCGLEITQKREIEKAFVTGGYTNIYLMESVVALAPIAEEYGTEVVCVIGGDLVEFAILNGRKILSGYSLDMGGNAINRKIIEHIEDLYKLNIKWRESEAAKLGIGSLFARDTSSFSLTGRDILTGKPKKLVISAKEIYEQIIYVFTRIIKLIDGALSVAPASCVQNIETKGVLFAGGGAAVLGLEEYIYKKLNIPVFLEEKPYLTHLRGAYQLMQDEAFINSYLGISDK
ncbi:MAG TPA: rod shape-determining protein [Clostridia bacterium]|nr:rod shape-determining protein [Clostridia bacterium]